MTPLVSQILKEAEKLLQDKRFPEALSWLKDIDRSSLKGEDHGYYCILLTEAGLKVGDYSEDCIDEAIEIFRFSNDTEKFAKAKFLKAWLLSSLGRHHEAKEVSLEAYTNYLRCNKPKNAARVLNWLSFGLFQTGNVEAAISNLKKCIEIYDQLGETVTKTKVAHNLAHVYFVCGQLRSSLSTYDSYPISELKSEEKPVLNFCLTCSMIHAFRGDISTAKDLIEGCRAHLGKYVRERALYYEYLGWISLLDADYDPAEKALESGLEISLGLTPEGDMVCQIKRLFGDLYVATSKLDFAEQYAKEALEVAERIGERKEIAACYRIFAQIEQHRGNENKARKWYKKAIDLFNLIGSRYELAVTRYLAATSGLFYNGERTAMLYLAKEYFESEDITHYVEKTNAQLSKIQSPRRIVTKSGNVSKSVDACKSSDVCPTIIAVNPQMKKLIEFAEHVAESEMTVLLTGATGTGKDLLARYIHYCSGRTGEFVAVNAAAIPNTMIESELFGHRKGAFTGASQDRPGLFEQADGGTFYLDEIADATPEFQAKLLRVLETRSVRRLGENKTRRVAFRLIAASNHDLHQRMRDNLFRPDLYHRLNEICIDVPSLEYRTEDIPALVEHFLTLADFDLSNSNEKDIERLGKILSQHSWPGNVRQLKAEVTRLWLAAKSDVGRMIELAQERELKSEPEELLELLEQTNWNRREVARILGVSEATIRHRIKKYCLAKESKIS